ncbi:MAG: GFA family protein [Cyanobacteria bacterium P01_A01_bin.116]
MRPQQPTWLDDLLFFLRWEGTQVIIHLLERVTMTRMLESKGRCLCGAVSFTAKNVSSHIGACHCSMCRTWVGGPFVTTECGSEVSFEGSANITVFNSSDWAERGFCAQCGTHLFYRLKETQDYFMPVGIFADDSSFLFDHQVFIDEKPEFYAFANKTNNMTGAEAFAQYAAASSQDETRTQ